jgi:hypothetical protein
MIGDIVGYCIIKNSATTGITPGNINDFLGIPLRVLEFSAVDGSVLTMNSKADALGMFDKSDIITSFRCSVIGNIICPPDLSHVEKYAYIAKAMSRRGGYDQLIGRMVIAASLAKGQFNDAFLFV